ncbi:protein ARV1 isoform X1 [Ostrinia furnacalis]|uniref:protein ARV1 isoform X1 n=1 Tax=Ostrinia furnacalis TaxID=93504 RepID=UPI00103AD40A|nr:protein ARV1 isoform X1 [Ostrinia furnacalis]
METVDKQYRCVNCGAPAAALFKSYGPSVLKLTKCEICKGIVDKYIEYDPVIVMIDIVLMSREAQRHVLYNTEFKSYWKLLIILTLLETFGEWRNDSLFSIVINSICGLHKNSTYLNIPEEMVPLSFKNKCWAWDLEEKTDDIDLFIWEKDFYVRFIATFSGIVMFILFVNSLMKIQDTCFSLNTVTFTRILKGFSLANVSILFTLPMLVWGNAASLETKLIHYALVLGYSIVMFTNVFTVLYESPVLTTFLILAVSNVAKYVTSFNVTPYLRELIS